MVGLRELVQLELLLRGPQPQGSQALQPAPWRMDKVMNRAACSRLPLGEFGFGELGLRSTIREVVGHVPSWMDHILSTHDGLVWFDTGPVPATVTSNDLQLHSGHFALASSCAVATYWSMPPLTAGPIFQSTHTFHFRDAGTWYIGTPGHRSNLYNIRSGVHLGAAG